MQFGTTDASIRTALRSRLATRIRSSPDAVVVEELPVYRGDVRLDLALIGSTLDGWEIKSDADTLERLPRQERRFSAAMDRMTLVTASRHLEAAAKALPDWWGIVEAMAGKRGTVKFRQLRRGRINPKLDASEVVGLLERDELYRLLCWRKLHKGLTRATWWDLAALVEERIPLRKLRPDVRDCLRYRAWSESKWENTAFGRSAFGPGMDAQEAQWGERSAQDYLGIQVEAPIPAEGQAARPFLDALE